MARREAEESWTSADDRTSVTPPLAALSRAGSMNVASFVPIVARTSSPITGADFADIAIHFWGLTAFSRDQKKLFPHLGEAGTAVFAKEEVEYGGHDRTPLFDRDHVIISFVGHW
jgi:hypothetical protein